MAEETSEETVGWRFESVVGVGVFAKNGKPVYSLGRQGIPLVEEADVRVGDTILFYGPTGEHIQEPTEAEIARSVERYGRNIIEVTEHEVWGYTEGNVVVARQVVTLHRPEPYKTMLWVEKPGYAQPLLFDHDDRHAWTTLSIYK